MGVRLTIDGFHIGCRDNADETVLLHLPPVGIRAVDDSQDVALRKGEFVRIGSFPGIDGLSAERGCGTGVRVSLRAQWK